MKKKCLFSIMLTLFIVLSSVNVLAESQEEQAVDLITSQDLNETSVIDTINSASLLSKNEVQAIAEIHIKGYLSDDVQTKGRALSVSTDS